MRLNAADRLPLFSLTPSSESLFMSRKIRYGMVGGGRGAFIGGVHRIAANIDGQIELVCGAFSSDPRSRKLRRRLFSAGGPLLRHL
jgi:hypothetical protein